jgi:hypothetical protein
VVDGWTVYGLPAGVALDVHVSGDDTEVWAAGFLMKGTPAVWRFDGLRFVDVTPVQMRKIPGKAGCIWRGTSGEVWVALSGTKQNLWRRDPTGSWSAVSVGPGLITSLRGHGTRRPWIAIVTDTKARVLFWDGKVWASPTPNPTLNGAVALILTAHHALVFSQDAAGAGVGSIYTPDGQYERTLPIKPHGSSGCPLTGGRVLLSYYLSPSADAYVPHWGILEPSSNVLNAFGPAMAKTLLAPRPTACVAGGQYGYVVGDKGILFRVDSLTHSWVRALEEPVGDLLGASTRRIWSRDWATGGLRSGELAP